MTYAELSADTFFEDKDVLGGFLEDTGISVERPDTQTLFRAGKVFQRYLERRVQKPQFPECGEKTMFSFPECGATLKALKARQHIPADYVIGSHAEENADRLLTLDNGFFDDHFYVEVLGVKNN